MGASGAFDLGSNPSRAIDYPNKSTILVVGPPGIGKEAFGYWFTSSGLVQGDFCPYVTRLSVKGGKKVVIGLSEGELS